DDFIAPLLIGNQVTQMRANFSFFLFHVSKLLIIFLINILTHFFEYTLDFMIRVFINPRFSPSLIAARLIVQRQTPEYVGAAQKKFAWWIGVAMAATMFVFFIIVNAYSMITGIICLICLVFLFFESVFGICLGCMFYPLFFKDKVQYCPGEVCDVRNKQDIQKTSGSQFLVLLAFVVFIVLTVFVMNDHFREQPYDFFGNVPIEQAK
ncbi:MAG: DUF4395 domain-containing protein, partial [Bacteroidetes bacterium]|nr:DUF4395 domain-containing protein [Bacteroidota bacterium]